MLTAERIQKALDLGSSVNPVGHSLVLGAADWRRVGMTRPVAATILPTLAYPHLDARRRIELSDEKVYSAGIKWATQEINPTVSLLQPCEGDAFTVTDYALDIISRRGSPIPGETWEVVIKNATLPELLTLGYTASGESQLPQSAEGAWRNAIRLAKANADAVPVAALDLGNLLNKHGDWDGAREAYQRAMESGDARTAATAATQLGDLLNEHGDWDGAREAYRRAMESGDARTAATAATQLGDLLNEHGDWDGAREAYRRAMESGDARTAATAATQLGDLLKEQGDRDGARDAYHLAPSFAHGVAWVRCWDEVSCGS